MRKIVLILTSLVSLFLIYVFFWMASAFMMSAFATMEIVIKIIFPIWLVFLILNIISWKKFKKDKYNDSILFLGITVVLFFIAYSIVIPYLGNNIAKNSQKFYQEGDERTMLFLQKCKPISDKARSDYGLSFRGFDCPPNVKQRIQEIDKDMGINWE